MIITNILLNKLDEGIQARRGVPPTLSPLHVNRSPVKLSAMLERAMSACR